MQMLKHTQPASRNKGFLHADTLCHSTPCLTIGGSVTLAMFGEEVTGSRECVAYFSAIHCLIWTCLNKSVFAYRWNQSFKRKKKWEVQNVLHRLSQPGKKKPTFFLTKRSTYTMHTQNARRGVGGLWVFFGLPDLRLSLTEDSRAHPAFISIHSTKPDCPTGSSILNTY